MGQDAETAPTCADEDIASVVRAASFETAPTVEMFGIIASELRLLRHALDRRNVLLAESNAMVKAPPKLTIDCTINGVDGDGAAKIADTIRDELRRAILGEP